MILLTLITGDRIGIDIDDIDNIEPSATGAIVSRRDGEILTVMQNARTLQTRVNVERASKAAKPKSPSQTRTKATRAEVDESVGSLEPTISFGSRTKRRLLGQSSTQAFFIGNRIQSPRLRVANPST